MRIMTSNIWGDYFGNETRGRDSRLLGVYRKYSPDVIGFQEVTKSWYESCLFEGLSSDYYFVGTEMYNYDPIAIKKEFPLVAKGFEYLNGTPDESKAVTWAVIRKNEKTLAVCNTHFWWMRGTESEQTQKDHGVLGWTLEDHNTLRGNNAGQLTRLMKLLSDRFSCPVFAFGDMNSTVSEAPFEVYAENGVKQLIRLASVKDTICSIHGDPVRGEDGAYHGKKADAEYIKRFRKALCLPELSENAEGRLTSIDHIIGLGEGFTVSEYRVIEDTDALDATDHSPVYADIEF